MANLAFLNRIMQNVKSEADWLADESYQIIPNQSVEAYVTKQVEVEGVQKNMLFVRSKTNTTNSNKLFKNLPYDDEYLMYMVQDNIDTALQSVTNEVNTLSGTVSTIGVDVGTLKTEVADNTSNIETLTTELENVGTLIDEKLTSAYKASGSVASASALPTASSTTLGNVYNVTAEFDTTADFIEGAGKKVPAGSNVVIVEESTGVYKYDVVGSFIDTTNYMTKTETETAIGAVSTEVSSISGTVSTLSVDVGTVKSDITTLSGKVDTNSTNITNMQGDLNTAIDEVSGLSGTVSTLSTDMANKAPLASPALTGTPTAPTAAKGTNTTQVATTQYVQTELANFSGGVDVQISSTQPTNQKSGDVWFKIVS